MNNDNYKYNLFHLIKKLTYNINVGFRFNKILIGRMGLYLVHKTIEIMI